jgi:hypothetical protein
MSSGVWTLAVALGCVNWSVTEVDGLRRLQRTVHTDADGLRQVRLVPEDREVALLWTTLASEGALVRMRSWTGPGGELLFDADDQLATSQAKTSAAWLGAVNTFAWPIVATDPDLVDRSWIAELQTTDDSGLPVSVEVALDVLLKIDDDLTAGLLEVHIVLQDDIADDADAMAALDDALEQWANLVAPLGLELEATMKASSTKPVGAPGLSAAEPWEEIGSAAPLRPVEVVLRRLIPDFPTVLGITGNIPAPLVPTGESGVLVSMDYAAGPDGVFDDLDIRLLAETLAHETAHAAGLFHPVEIGWTLYDALPDTETCTREGACEDAFATNLMFPYPVCPSFVDCIPQIDLTPDQRAVAQRYVATR